MNDYNLIVPLLTRQKVHFDAQKEIARAQGIYETLIKSKEDAEGNPNSTDQGEGEKTPGVNTGFFNWTNMWKFIKTWPFQRSQSRPKSSSAVLTSHIEARMCGCDTGIREPCAVLFTKLITAPVMCKEKAGRDCHRNVQPALLWENSKGRRDALRKNNLIHFQV